jgi:2',5'-phosphodiesterase
MRIGAAAVSTSIIIRVLTATAAVRTGSFSAASSASLLFNRATKGGAFSTTITCSMSTTTAPGFRVVTYNLLSSSLSNAKDHHMCSKAALEPNTRLERIKAKLQPEMQKHSVLCLQEVSIMWVGLLHVWLQSRGYVFIATTYGNRFNGYMGVGIAYPLAQYEPLAISISSVAETKKWGYRPAPSTLAKFTGSLASMLKLLPWSKPRGKSLGGGRGDGQPADAYQLAKSKWNQMVFVKLRDRGFSEKPFCVATYHMPCVFKVPATMALHTALACQHLHKLAAGDPYVFAGDFNFKPGDGCYELVTTGSIDSKNVACPIKPAWEEDIEFEVLVEPPLKSAYYEVQGEEPELTNWSCIGDNGEFDGCLDYVFYSDGLRPNSVIPLQAKCEMRGPLPTEAEPSDHVLVGSSFNFGN